MEEEYFYIKLANGIIEQAVIDYRKCLKRLKWRPHSTDALNEKIKIEEFFRSHWFNCLTDLNAEMLINKLNDEVTR